MAYDRPAQIVSASGRGKKKGHVCSRIEIEPTTNGGFAVKKFYRPEDTEPRKGDSCCGPHWIEPEPYAFSNQAELMAWLKSAFSAKA